jgi:hypothetical protein
MIAIMALLLMGAAYVLLGSLSAASLRVDRDRVTREAMLKAKEALIGYAVSDPNRPGELPCPDVNDDGKVIVAEDTVGSACASLVGRLPWSTLGLPDLRDGNGERLWYALSDDFHANGNVALNSDTAYRTVPVLHSSLTIAGTQAAANVVAIVFSAGAPLQRADGVSQVRGCTQGVNCDATSKCTPPASLTPKCNPVNFLDAVGGVDNAVPTTTTFISSIESASFNDRLLPVLSDDIMSLVQKRAGRQIAQHLRDHFDAWQTTLNVVGTKAFYPWAAPFADPTTSQAGTSGTLYGMAPFGSIVWTSASYSIAGIPQACSGVGTDEITCSGIAFLGSPSISASIGNIAGAFVGPPTGVEVTYVSGLILGAPTWTLNVAAQTLNFSFSGLALGSPSTTIQVKVPAASSWSAWLTTNNWHQDAYYAISPGYAINGTGTCGGAGPQCVTISNTAAPNNDKQAVVVMTGRALTPAQNARPVNPATLVPADYLEGVNTAVAPGSLVFENNLRSQSFNDQPIAVRP